MNSSQSYRIAVIDLGSNTARLVVMVARPGYAYRLEDEIREVVRLRQEMSPAGLSEAAMSRAIATLRLFKRFCTSTNVDIILPTATSAVREAANGPIFLERVLQEVGLPLRLLDGSQEAYYATLGALNEVPMFEGLVLDMGGGSIASGSMRMYQWPFAVIVPDHANATAPNAAAAVPSRIARRNPNISMPASANIA